LYAPGAGKNLTPAILHLGSARVRPAAAKWWSLRNVGHAGTCCGSPQPPTRQHAAPACASSERQPEQLPLRGPRPVHSVPLAMNQSSSVLTVFSPSSVSFSTFSGSGYYLPPERLRPPWVGWGSGLPLPDWGARAQYAESHHSVCSQS
jgi:hypothetical protein